MKLMTYDDTVLSKRASIVLAGCDARRKVTLISLLMTTVTDDSGGLPKGKFATPKKDELSRFSTSEYFRAKRLFSLVLELSAETKWN